MSSVIAAEIVLRNVDYMRDQRSAEELSVTVTNDRTDFGKDSGGGLSEYFPFLPVHSEYTERARSYSSAGNPDPVANYPRLTLLPVILERRLSPHGAATISLLSDNLVRVRTRSRPPFRIAQNEF